uniref:Putative secreted protein n=1 Tax=Anopheles triannulatus TaxID=58253 RepID=A0A2M4B1F1_9DIPT
MMAAATIGWFRFANGRLYSTLLPSSLATLVSFLAVDSAPAITCSSLRLLYAESLKIGCRRRRGRRGRRRCWYTFFLGSQQPHVRSLSLAATGERRAALVLRRGREPPKAATEQ